MSDKTEQAAVRDEAALQRLATSLLRIDIDALRKIEAQYQGDVHKAMYGVDLSDTKTVMEYHARMKYVHLFVDWIAARLSRLNGGNREG